MKFGIHAGLWMARWSDDITPIVRTIADLGYDGIEVSLLGMSEEKACALGQQIRMHEMEVTCSHGLSPQSDITSPDPDIRAAGLVHLQWAIHTCARLGSHALGGVIYAPWGRFDPIHKAERTARSAEILAKLSPDLETYEVTLAIEAINRFETDLVNTATQAVALARAAGAGRVGVLLDTFHLNIEEKDIKAAITRTGDHLVHFHVSDNDRGVPGSGHIAWNEVRDGLTEIGYDGWVVAEMFVIAGTPAAADLNIWRNIEPDSTIAAREALENMRRIFQ